MFLADIWTGTVELTALLLLALVLRWMGEQCALILQSWIAKEKVQTERVEQGTILMREFAPRIEGKVDRILSILEAM